jgi:hypothetical protein
VKETGDDMEHVWETFDALYRTVNAQARKIEELEARLAKLETDEEADIVMSAQAEDRLSVPKAA